MIRLLELKQKISLASQESDSGLKYDSTLVHDTFVHSFSPGLQNENIKESNPTTLHCAHLLLLLFGVSFQLITNMGMNKHRVRDRKILSSIVEVSECGEDFHISDEDLSVDGQVEVNA